MLDCETKWGSMEAADVIIWAISGVAAVGVSIGAYINGRATKAIELSKENQLETARFRAHVSENYSTKNEVQIVRADTQHSLDRIHQRLDEIIRALTTRAGS